MKRLFSARWRHQHWRTLRATGIATAAVVAAAGITTAAVAAGVTSSSSSGGWGDAQVGTQNAEGVLLASDQRVKPAGTRLLITDGRLLSSAVSPNGEYMASLSWYDFTGFLTIFDLKTNPVVQQVDATGGMGDGTVAADGPLWSSNGTTLWVPQTSDLLRYTVAATARSAAARSRSPSSRRRPT